MSGRDPDEPHRSATPLELLFDLAFVVAFGQAGDQFSHMIAAGHTGAAIGAFAFAILAITWAWINFSWFASAYDTDDWFYRLTTLIQMIGVVILTLGIPPLFTSIEEGHHVDSGVLVAGYVVMRIAVVTQWLRAAKQDPQHRRICLSHALFVGLAQLGWVALALANTTLVPTFAFSILLYTFELAGPWISLRRNVVVIGHETIGYRRLALVLHR